MAFYKITTPNGQINYLFGTLHSNDINVNKLPKEVAEAFKEATTLLVETELNAENLETSKALGRWYDKHLDAHKNWMKNPQNASDATAKVAKHSSWYVSGLYTNLLVQGMPPVLLALHITYFSHAKDVYLDKNLVAMAKKQKKTVVGLQPPSDILDMYTAIALQYKEQRQVFELLMKDYSNSKAREKLKKLIADYLDDKIPPGYEVIENPDKNPLITKVNRTVLEDRDVIMAKNSEPYFNQGNAFVAVGAAHLPGIAKIYEAKPGYKVELIHVSPRIYPVLDYSSRHFSQMLATGVLLITGGAGLALGLTLSPYVLTLGLLIVSALLLALASLLLVKLINDYLKEPVLGKAVNPVTASKKGFFAARDPKLNPPADNFTRAAPTGPG